MKALALVVAALAIGCGDNTGEYQFMWNGNRLLCSDSLDDYKEAPKWDRIDERLAEAEQNGWVSLFHAHVPGETVSREALDHLFTLADAHHLPYLEFNDLEPYGPPRAGIAFAFDDASPDQWTSVRDILDAHGVRLTLFITRWFEMDDAQHAEIHQFYEDGADIEPHTVNHGHAPAYVAANGMDAYMTDEVMPSFQVLTDAGYPPATAFAYPYGDHTQELDDRLLGQVGFVRTTLGQCMTVPQ